jgi:hypothetical protein
MIARGRTGAPMPRPGCNTAKTARRPTSLRANRTRPLGRSGHRRLPGPGWEFLRVRFRSGRSRPPSCRMPDTHGRKPGLRPPASTPGVLLPQPTTLCASQERYLLLCAVIYVWLRTYTATVNRALTGRGQRVHRIDYFSGGSKESGRVACHDPRRRERSGAGAGTRRTTERAGSDAPTFAAWHIC